MVTFHFHPFPELFTERLHLRQLITEDAPEIFSLLFAAIGRTLHKKWKYTIAS